MLVLQNQDLGAVLMTFDSRMNEVAYVCSVIYRITCVCCRTVPQQTHTHSDQRAMREMRLPSRIQAEAAGFHALREQRHCGLSM